MFKVLCAGHFAISVIGTDRRGIVLECAVGAYFWKTLPRRPFRRPMMFTLLIDWGLTRASPSVAKAEHGFQT
jgi:hypothetical protein